MKQIPIADIHTESGTQTRVMINEETVSEYAEAMEGGAEFPPVVVFHDGTDYYMADGFHRIMAASRNGFVDIAADVHKGTKQDALIYALGANVANGLRRNNQDKRRCVEIALKEFPDWSDRKIADICGVNNSFVGIMRKELCTVDSSQQPTKRIGIDGKARSMPTKPTRDGWIAPEVRGNTPATAAPVPEAKPKSQQIETRPCVGMMHAENAIRQLEKISNIDTEYEDALKHVATWAVNKLEERNGGQAKASNY